MCGWPRSNRPEFHFSCTTHPRSIAPRLPYIQGTPGEAVEFLGNWDSTAGPLITILELREEGRNNLRWL